MPLYSRRLSRLRSLVLMAGCVLLLLVVLKYYSHSYTSTVSTINMRKLLVVSMELAKRGGDRLWSIRKGHIGDSSSLDSMVKGKTREGAVELLTRGDLESHHIIHSGLKATFPHLLVIA